MKISILFCFGVLSGLIGLGQNTIGLLNNNGGSTDGYVLFSPITSTSTYLINKCGEKVHEWNSSNKRPALSCHLMEDGSLMRSGKLNNPNFNEGGNGGVIEQFDWDGNLIWSFELSDSNVVQHHDFKVLPNGNVLLIAWDRYTNAQALAAGKDTNYSNSFLWSEKILEIKPIGLDSGEVVWEWKLWDHLIQELDSTKPNFGDVTEHPERVNINYFPGQPSSMDWIHLNSIDYHPGTDQILVSSHTLNEIWIIDHSTNILEAASSAGGNAGKGGDLLYRWGNPQSYQRGGPINKVFYGQHHATWIPNGFPDAGKILVFNNGLNRTGNYSSIDMIDPPIDSLNRYSISAQTSFLPTDLQCRYTDPTPSSFYSSNISGVYPLSNGSFLVTSGASGTFFELNDKEEITWKYINPVAQSGILSQGDQPSNNEVFRSEFYPTSYPGLTGKDLSSKGPIELNASSNESCSILSNLSIALPDRTLFEVYPNPTSNWVTLQSSISDYWLRVTDWMGTTLLYQQGPRKVNLAPYPDGVYLFTLQFENGTQTATLVVKQ